MLGIIPAAGKGTRFHELGKQYPKCILPYKEKPILVHNIYSLIQAGCTEIVIGANHQVDMITKVVDDWFPFTERPVRINVKKITETVGMPDTIRKCLFDVDINRHMDGLVIMLGDIISELPIHPERYSWVSVQRVSDYARWCMAEETDYGSNIKCFHDKPDTRPDTNLALSGIYFFTNLSEFNKQTVNWYHEWYSGQDESEQQLSKVLTKMLEIDTIETKLMPIIDLGTHTEFIQNRGLSTSRSFNKITKYDNIVIKSSSDGEKMRAEYNWFKDLPIKLKHLAPQVYELNMGHRECSYSMEFITKPTLREQYLFLDGSLDTWERIFDDLFTINEDLCEHTNSNRDYLGKVLEKTKSRFYDIDKDMRSSYTAIYTHMMFNLENMIKSRMFYRKTDSLAHGDFCFSNILWDEHGVKLIDPRGEYYGSVYMEMAKLYHSVIGMYDFIDAELYVMRDGEAILYDNGKEDIQVLFLDYLETNFSDKEICLIKMLCASLFCSMVPLHSHNETNQVLFLNKFREIYLDAEQEYNSF